MLKLICKVNKAPAWPLSTVFILAVALLLSACSTETLKPRANLATQRLCDDFRDCILIPIEKPWLDPGPYAKVKFTVVDEVEQFVAQVAVKKDIAEAVALSLANETGEAIAKADLTEDSEGMVLRLKTEQLEPGSYNLQLHSEAKEASSLVLELGVDAEQAPLLLWSFDQSYDGVLADVATVTETSTLVVSYNPEEMAAALADKAASRPDLILSPWSLGACEHMACPEKASLNTLALCDYCGDFVAVNPNPFIPIYKQDKFTAVQPFEKAKSVPVAWDVFSMYANPAWFAEQDLTMPTNATGVLGLVEANPRALSPKGDGTGYFSWQEWLRKKLKDLIGPPRPNWQAFLEAYIALDPTPDPWEPDPEAWKIGLVMGNLSSLFDGPDPTPWEVGLILEDLSAVAKATQTIINMDSHQAEQATAFADALRGTDAQHAIFAASGQLPVHMDVLNEVTESSQELIQYGLDVLAAQ